MTSIEINTDRLLLRQWQDSDFPKFAEMNSCNEVMEYFPNKLSEPQSNFFASRLATLIAERGWGLWATEEKESNNFIGFIGLHEVVEELHFSPALEIGWRLSNEFWGKGYATEGAKAVLNVAFEKLGIDEIVSLTSVINVKSEAVMKRIGMVNTNSNFMHPKIPEGSPLKEHLLYKITKEQWRNRKL